MSIDRVFDTHSCAGPIATTKLPNFESLPSGAVVMSRVKRHTTQGQDYPIPVRCALSSHNLSLVLFVRHSIKYTFGTPSKSSLGPHRGSLPISSNLPSWPFGLETRYLLSVILATRATARPHFIEHPQYFYILPHPIVVLGNQTCFNQRFCAFFKSTLPLNNENQRRTSA
ncbi:hypothetical protein BX600DRAFT_62703 [Xylariales sp. PMI_506]|nr:hypothetical protein BX600DRAFT_62703 [Xylariales sp. PMI_506]